MTGGGESIRFLGGFILRFEGFGTVGDTDLILGFRGRGCRLFKAVFSSLNDCLSLKYVWLRISAWVKHYCKP